MKNSVYGGDLFFLFSESQKHGTAIFGKIYYILFLLVFLGF